jgi:hypothetical protein
MRMVPPFPHLDIAAAMAGVSSFAELDGMHAVVLEKSDRRRSPCKILLAGAAEIPVEIAKVKANFSRRKYMVGFEKDPEVKIICIE